MQYLNVNKKEVDIKKLRQNSASETDCTILIKEDTTVILNGVPIIVYIADTSNQAQELFDALTQIKYQISARGVSGIVTEARIFGYAPRFTTRNQPCRSVSLAYEQPKLNKILKNFASIAAKYYNDTNQDLAKHHTQLTEDNVLPMYRMNESMFTSGIVNKNNPLKYHFDSGNYVGVWSAMFAFKEDIKGGHLACPEFDLAFECANQSLIMFDGQSILHGVTPIFKLSSTAKRYTVVYYSLKRMWSCESTADEVENMQAMRSKNELIKRGEK